MLCMLSDAGTQQNQSMDQDTASMNTSPNKATKMSACGMKMDLLVNL